MTAGSGTTTIDDDTQQSATNPRSTEPTCSGPAASGATEDAAARRPARPRGVGLTILIWDHFHRVNTLALALSSGVVLAVIIRMAVIFAENLGRARNETEQLALQNDRLLEVDRLRDAFVSVVSHELRTPLTSVCGYLELLQHGEGGPVTDEQHRLMTVIDRNARRLLRLVGDLLFVGQVEAGKLTLELGPVDLDDLAAQSAETARTHAADNGVELVLREGDSRC